MKAEVTKRTDTHISFTITADAEELQHAKEHAYDKYRPKVKVAGFRPGKAPDAIVVREIGDAALQQEALEHAIGHSYSAAVSAEKVAVIAPPDVQVKKFVPYTELEYEATVEIIPPVTLPDYKKIRKAAKKVSVDTKKIDEMVEDLRRRVAQRIPAIRPAELGDEVKFDFDGVKDDQPVPGASGKNYTLTLGSRNFIPGFEEELVGLKVGEAKTFTITFPTDYHEKSLAGQAVVFTIKLHEVTELKLPEVTDAFAGEVGPFKTVEELRADIKNQLMIEAEQVAKREYENELLDELIAKSKMTAPERLIAQQLERMQGEMKQRLASSGLTMEHYLSAQGQTKDELEKQMRPEAEKRVKLALALSEIARQEKIAVDPEEIEREIEGLRLQYTDPAMQKELEGEQIREDVYNHLMAGKVVNNLITYAQS